MDGSLRLAYREQFKMYASLTQEEVESIYAREGIQDKPITEIIKELEDEIRALKSEQNYNIRKVEETICESQNKRVQEITSRIELLEEKRNELNRIQRELEELMVGIDRSSGVSFCIDMVDKEIARLKSEYHEREKECKEIDAKKDEIYRELKNKIRAAEEKLSKIRLDYASVFKQLYSASRGIIKKNRKFPSSELRNEIVLGHLELARYLASKYYKMCDKKIEFDDLLQTAFEALMSAAYYYIPSPRAKFKTYATKCIENKLRRVIGKSKNKQKKRPTKPLDFIDEELRRVDYIMMLVDACRNVRGKDGNNYFTNHFDLKPTWVQYQFKRTIQFYNSELRKLGLTKEQLPSFKVNKSTVGLQEILKIAQSYMKESKMKVLISSGDLEIASLVVSYENHPRDVKEIYELLYTLELYQKRLRDVRMLLEVEIELANNSDGIVPSKKEILDEVNRRIALENKGIYKAKSSYTRVSYKYLHSYYSIYCDLWDVDFLVPKEHENSRANEKKELEDSFEYFVDEALLSYRCLIGDISNSLENEMSLYRHLDSVSRNSSFLITWDADPWESLEEKVFTKEQAIEFVKGLVQELSCLSKDDYVDMALKRRKQITLDELKRLNSKVIEENRTMEDTIRQQNATRYVRYWTMENVQNASEWLNALYENGLSFRNSNSGKVANSTQSVEDEVIGNLFMADYTSALSDLSPLARDILNLYYDENGTHSTKVSEIAERLGVTEKVIYREKAKALRFLRNNERLKAYLE